MHRREDTPQAMHESCEGGLPKHWCPCSPKAPAHINGSHCHETQGCQTETYYWEHGDGDPGLRGCFPTNTLTSEARGAAT